jgi:hypothetical protein
MNNGSVTQELGYFWALLAIVLALLTCATDGKAVTCDPDYSNNYSVCLYGPQVTGNATSAQIKLTWLKYGTSPSSADYPEADALGIWRGGTKLFSTSNVNGVTQFTDLGLKPATKYDYTFCAYWTQFQDQHSSFTHPSDPEPHINNSDPAFECENVSYATVGATPTLPKAPNVEPPQNLRTGSVNYVAVGLLWLSAPIAGPNPAVSDTISWVKTGQTTGAQTMTRATFPDEAVTVLIAPLDPATSYTFTVCAVGKLGDRSCAPLLVVRTPAPPPAPMPGATEPTGVIAVRYGPQSVTVSWAKTNFDTFYRVERRVVSTHIKKTPSDNGVSVGDWIVASPQLPKLPNAYSDSPPALNPGESLQYRVCGLFITQPAAKCSPPVDVTNAQSTILLK